MSHNVAEKVAGKSIKWFQNTSYGWGHTAKAIKAMWLSVIRSTWSLWKKEADTNCTSYFIHFPDKAPWGRACFDSQLRVRSTEMRVREPISPHLEKGNKEMNANALLIFLILVYFCMCTCQCEPVTRSCMWRPEVNVQCPPQSRSTLIFFKNVPLFFF